jgi:penicillin-binding protein 2
VVRRLAPRGTIFDRQSRVLATSRLSFSIRAVSEELEAAGWEDTAAGISHMLGLPVAEVRASLAQPAPARYEPIVLWRDADPEVVARFEEHLVYLSGLTVVADAVRQYPHGSLAAHLLGYVREINQDDLADNADYRPGDLMGKAGVERVAEEVLRGVDGGDQIEVDARGRRVRTLGTVPPERGRNLWLTIDLGVQEAAEEALGEQAGAVVALDPNTGEVLALVSHPAYDLNMFSGMLDPGDWRKLGGPEHPLQNRAVSARFEPGSVFKIVTAAAALEAGTTSTTDRFFCGGVYSLGGWRLRCWKRDGHGSEDFLHGFAQSCNVMFATIGRRAGPEKISEMARRFGLGQKTEIDLPDEATGLIPSPDWKRRVRKQPWYAGDTAQMSIGQGECLVTPLQIAREASVVANGGYLITPHIIAKMEGAEAPPPAEKRSVGLSPETLAALRAGMAGVVAEGGTAHRIWTDKYAISGKTGTAQNPRGKTHAWFTGFAPSDSPRIAVAVMVEHGGGGTATAAPIARHVFDAMLLPPDQRTPWPQRPASTVAALPQSGRHE